MLAILVLSAGLSAASPGAVDFNRDVRPLLSDRCSNCHGPDAKKREAGLRFDLAPGQLPAQEAAERAEIMGAGRPDESEFVRRLITDDPDELMPPPDSGLKLSAEEIETLRGWVAEGAKFSEHWAFVKPTAPDLPAVKRPDWCRSEIDYFVLAKLEASGRGPSPEADRATLLRRLSFSLTGLPPPPSEVDAFVNDPAPTAYQTTLLRLLQSKRFGERMAVDWLDAARYADTSGYQYDWPRTMWRWRDWVIDAFNNNLPYNAFIEWQLAGDLLPNAQPFQVVATGFNRNHGFTIESGTLDEEYRVQYINDRVTTMGTAMLGLTLDCARCHDHKYDPISMRDYYGLFAFFNKLDEFGSVGGKPRYSKPAMPTPTGAQRQEAMKLERELGELQSRLLAPDPDANRAQLEWEKNYRSIWQPLDSFAKKTGKSDDARSQGQLRLLAGKRANVWLGGVVSESASASGLRIRLDVSASEGLALFDPAIVRACDVWHKPAGEEKQPLAVANALCTLPERESAGALFDRDAPDTWALPMNTPSAMAIELEETLSLAAGDAVILFLELVSPLDAVLSVGTDLARVDRAIALDPTGGLDAWIATPAALRDRRAAMEVSAAFRTHYHAPYRATGRQVEEAAAAIRSLNKDVSMTMIMRDEIDRETFVLERGAYDKPREKVVPATPAIFPPMPAEVPRNRLGLARWLTAPENPLTARVAVNRVWRQMFGHGLVRTPEDFGSQGEAPTHPALLDWLAVDFVRNGWNVKRLVQQICLSSTWRQSSTISGGGEVFDPNHRLLARYPRRRLPAEMLRDNALSIAGLLTEQIGGPSVKPYQPDGLWEALTNREEYRQRYERDSGRSLYRRGLYVYWKRASHHPVMALFDAPSRETCAMRRPTTNTPLQALALLNETAFIESARALAGRMLIDLRFGRTDEQRIAHAFRTAASRSPDRLELFALRRLLDSERAAFAADSAEAERLLKVGEAPNPKGVSATELAAFTTVARAILNMSDAISLP